MEFAEWLKKKMHDAGFNSQTLADAIEENQPTIYRILTGETKNPRLHIIKKLESFFNEKYNFDKSASSEGVLIEQYDAHGAMGNGLILRDQSGVINEWQVSDEWLRLNIKNATSYKNLKIVTGFGDSMKGMFNSGDPLIIDIGIKTVEFDSVYFFRVGNEGFIKRLQRIPGIGLRAISENKAYESWNITEGMDFEVFGRVLKLWQGVDF